MTAFEDSGFNRYARAVELPDPAAGLARHCAETSAFLDGLSEEAGAIRYAPGKWSVKQVVGHITDAQAIFVYRSLCIARGESKPLPGFDENAYVEAAPFERLALAALRDRYRKQSEASLAHISQFDAGDWERRGNANGVDITPRQIARAIIGHERHHLQVLRERYGV